MRGEGEGLPPGSEIRLPRKSTLSASRSLVSVAGSTLAGMPDVCPPPPDWEAITNDTGGVGGGHNYSVQTTKIGTKKSRMLSQGKDLFEV